MAAHYEVAMVDVGQFDRNPQIGARFGYNTRLKGVPTILVVDPATNKLINGDHVFALSNAGHQTPQDLADYLARWTEPESGLKISHRTKEKAAGQNPRLFHFAHCVTGKRPGASPCRAPACGPPHA